jgi:beta-glucanase (GH16 family)
MTALFTLALASASASEPPPPLRATPDGRALALTFADEFDTFRWFNGRTGVWRTTYGDGTQQGLDRRSLPTNGELELYVDQSVLGLNPFTLRDGTLEITASPTPPELKPRLNNYQYLSGIITTQPSFAQTYGYFEIRAKLPKGKGLWPAFWLLPADQTWPPEIDVLEVLGDNMNKLYTTEHHGKEQSNGRDTMVPDMSADFHTYAVDWRPDTITWYFDGRQVYRAPTPPDMHKPMFLIANLGVGGYWPGVPDQSTQFPAKYVIDYIRAYRFAS